MGLLVLGEPLGWKETAKLKHYVKFHGIQQFIKVWQKHKDRKCDIFLWGDEIETLLLHINPENKQVQVQLRASDILEQLEEQQQESKEQNDGSEWNVIFHPEYGNFMLEVTPNLPYGSFTSDLLHVETNMRLRRTLLQSKLLPNEFILTACNFPLFGRPNFVHGPVRTETLSQEQQQTLKQSNNSDYSTIYKTNGPVLKSLYVPDEVMSPHPRFATLSGNIRRRRGKKVDIQLPIFKDVNTTYRDEHFDDAEFIHSDAMGFGMGACCLQVTFQTRSNKEARFLYDQLAILSPLFLSLTANTPFHRGVIVDTDVRWDTICQSVDDRTEGERGNLNYNPQEDKEYIPPTPPLSPRDGDIPIEEEIPQLNEENPFVTYFKQQQEYVMQTQKSQQNYQDDGVDSPYNGVGIPYNDIPLVLPVTPETVGKQNQDYQKPPLLHKSRYSSIDCYINNDLQTGYKPEYNDVKFPFHEPIYYVLRDQDIDSLMAKHIASLFVRDPLVMFKGQIDVDDNANVNHFESIQSSNWRSVRYKPPSHAASPGFRVEFRTMELQFTDFENAAFTTFITLLSRAIVYYNLNLYAPLTKVDENFITAHKKDSVLNDKFWWKVNINVADPYSNVYNYCNHKKCDENHVHNTPQQQFELTSTATTPASGIAGGIIPNFGLVQPDPDQFETPEHYNESHPQNILSTTAAFAADSSPTAVTSIAEAVEASKAQQAATPHDEDYFDLLTLNEIFNGCTKINPQNNKEYKYCGLVNIVKKYINTIIASAHDDIVGDARQQEILNDTVTTLNNYLDLISKRAAGELITGAALQRLFVTNHPMYKKDSMLNQQIVYDLSLFLHGLGNLNCTVPDLIGNLDPTTQNNSCTSAVVGQDDVICIGRGCLVNHLQHLYDADQTIENNRLKKLIKINEDLITSLDIMTPQGFGLDDAAGLPGVVLGDVQAQGVATLFTPPTNQTPQSSSTQQLNQLNAVASVPMIDTIDLNTSNGGNHIILPGNNNNNNNNNSVNNMTNHNNNTSINNHSITALSYASSNGGVPKALNMRSNSSKLLANPHTAKVGGSYIVNEAKGQLTAPQGAFLPGSIECTTHHPTSLQRMLSNSSAGSKQ